MSAETGRPSYHPSTMLKLYIYGYLNRIQSSRRLEREAGRNVELMWLLERLAPDFKTFADFRANKGDKIVLDNVLEGYDPVTDAITDFVQITHIQGAIRLSVDVNGGGGRFYAIAEITGVGSLTNEEQLLDDGALVIT